MVENAARQKITITGIVQGVGFRPFVYNRAKQYHLAGFITNTPKGVEIEVEGNHEALDSFVHDLKTTPPPLTQIRNFQTNPLTPVGAESFEIKDSKTVGETTVFISPDVAICRDCLAELFDPGDRRFHYPFINCTNCGPRYTITKKIPYDRSNTAMAKFPMCETCRREYGDPAGRRFHAQPNCCPQCGPQLVLLDTKSRMIAQKGAALDGAITLLGAGNIVAIKGLGGFHLAVDATDDAAVKRLRHKKGREEKPFAIMVADIAAAQKICSLSEIEESLLDSAQSPIVLAAKKENNHISENVAPGNDFFGIMLPYTPLHHLLLRKIKKPLVVTSGNMSEEPICTSNEEALDRLGNIADVFLVHDRDINTRVDDSIVMNAAGHTMVIRRSRGYAPMPVKVSSTGPPVLGAGGELKNTVCLLKNDEACIGQHVGDLTNLEAYRFFTETVNHLQGVFETKPEIIAHDLHPDYLSTQWAQDRQSVQTVGVQHHHAHLAACLAENMEAGPAIGLIMDGTGYGTDGTIWGGEVLIGDCRKYERYGHFATMPLPGGDAAVKNPWRTAVGYLYATYGVAIPDLPFLQEHDIDPLLELLDRDINCPQTSSCGRLFDAVAAMCNGRQQISYEAQAAIEFMQAGRIVGDKPFTYEIFEEQGRKIVSVESLIKEVAQSSQAGLKIGEISRRFHRTLVDLFVDLACMARQESNIDVVALSGGVFQNHLLFEALFSELVSNGFRVLTHKHTPVNDGCIALGQAVIARQVFDS